MASAGQFFLTGGGDNFAVTSTASDVMSAINSSSNIAEMVQVIDGDGTPLTAGGGSLTGGAEPASNTTVDEVVALFEGNPLLTANGMGSELVQPNVVYLADGGIDPQVLTTAAEVADLINTDPAASDLIIATGGGSGTLQPLPRTLLSGGVPPDISTTAADLTAFLASNTPIMTLLTASGNGTVPLQPAIIQLTGGGDDFEVLTTANDVVALLAAHQLAASLITATGAGTQPLQAFPRTGLSGGIAPAITSTAADVVTLLNADSQVSGLLTVTGGGNGTLQSATIQLAGGGAGFEIVSTANDVIALLQADPAVASLLSLAGGGTSPLQPLARTTLSGGAAPAITTTADEVVSLLAGHAQASELLSVSGGGGVPLQPAGPLALQFSAVPSDVTAYAYDRNGNRVSQAVDDASDPSRASLTSQGITFEAVNGGLAGCDLRVGFQEAAAGQPAAVAVNGNDIAVALAITAAASAGLLNQGLVYTARDAGSAGNAISMNLVPGSAGALNISVQGTAIQASLPTSPAAASSASMQGMRFTAVEPGAQGNSIEVSIPTPYSSQTLQVGRSGNTLFIVPGTDSDGNVTSTRDDIIQACADAADIAEWLLVTADNSSVFTGVNSSVGLSGGVDAGTLITTTRSELVAALQSDPAASALISVSGGGLQKLTALPVTHLSGGTNQIVSTTTAQAVALLNAHIAAAGMITASGGGSQLASPMPLTNLARPPDASHITSYHWDAQDRLAEVAMPDGKSYGYAYDYRTRRIGIGEENADGQAVKHTAVVFSGGLSLAEYESTSAQATIANPQSSTVHYLRGPDMGGGVGGLLYSLRGGAAKYNVSNGRGDIVAQADQSATLTWTASYEAYGKRTKETGENQDKQRGNSKDEDPTGLLNEGQRYRDIETGIFMSRDPAGFVDGPNLYAYVRQNPWTAFDPDGLEAYVSTDASNPKKISVNIKIPITYTGDTNPERIAENNKGIQDKWSGKFGKYQVRTTVVTPETPKDGNVVKLNERVADGTIEGASWVRFRIGRDGKWDKGDWKQQTTDKATREVAAHEAGHLMGLDDRYRDVGKDKNGNRIIEYKDPKARDNIMGNRTKKPDAADIEQVIKNGSPEPAPQPEASAKPKKKRK